MRGYTLTWQARGAVAMSDGALLRPDTLGRLERAALAAAEAPVGRRRVALGELFAIEGEPGDRLTLRGLPAIERLGEGMSGGELVIEGDAGDDLGASMSGGVIRVRGSAGARAGGPGHASWRGMTGGAILIDGDAGDYAGVRMRRGLIAVAGRCGASPGFAMLAGTIVVGRGPIEYGGLAMRRGTVLCLDGRVEMSLGAAFTLDGDVDATAAPAVTLLLRDLRDRLGWRGPAGSIESDITTTPARLRLFSGDRFEQHRGEVIQWRC